MNVKKMLIPALLAYAFFTFACVYVVLPEGMATPAAEEVEGAAPKAWSAVVTNVGKSDAGDLRIDLTIRNDTGDWSTMRAVEGKPAALTTDGKTTNCDTVFVGTGGHRFAPGFQMRGYTIGTMEEPKTQLIYVECKGAAVGAGSTLSIEYVSFGGILDDYEPEGNKTEGTMEVNLDEVAADLVYPIATPVDGLILDKGGSITGLSNNVITLLDVKRIDTGFEFAWENFNPSKFPLKTHIGTPPVIGSDGVLYGIYESLDIAEIPITAAKDKSDWSTVVVAPKDVKGFYILLSVESKKPRTYVNYVLDISDK